MKKKVRIGLFTGGLAAVLVSPAVSATVDFHGKGLLGLINTSNARVLTRGNGDPDSSTIGVGKFRLRAEVATDDGQAKLVYGFETGGNNFGGAWDYSGDSQDFENRFAYIQSTIPGLDNDIIARGGLQKTGINHWLWTETAAGFTLHDQGGVDWIAGWFRGIENDIADDKDDTDLFVAKAGFKPSADLEIGGFGVYAMDFGGKGSVEPDADQYWLGLTAELNGPIFASGDVIYQGGDAHTAGNEDVSAYLANLTVGTKLDERTIVSLNGLYVSGDDNRRDSDDESFEGIDADVDIGQIFFKDSLSGSLDRYYADQPHKLANGLINIALQGEVKLDEKNKIRVAARYLASAEEVTVNMATGEQSDELGYELDFWYSYKMNQNLTFKIEGAYLFSDDLSEHLLADDDDVYMLATGAVFAF